QMSVTVPFGQCTPSLPNPCIPVDEDPCCSPDGLHATCIRFDSAATVVFAGTPTYIPGPGFVFECPDCCKFTPVDCPLNDIYPSPRHCTLSPAYSFTETVTLSVSASITVSLEAVELALEASVGVTVGHTASVTLNCPLDTPKCKDTACQPFIKYLGGRQSR